MNQPTAREIQSTQGTRLSEAAPWETYSAELDQNLSPELSAAVAEYAERRYDEKPSSQMKEELHRQQEMSEETSKQYQWITPEEYADSGARIGNPMLHSEFITKLRSRGILCWYNQHVHHDKANLLWGKNSSTPPEVACWVQLGYMPELSIMTFDDHGVPLAERRRGWRTCLLQLILKGIISEAVANEEFGRPKQTEAFHRYNSTLQSFRNAGSSLSA